MNDARPKGHVGPTSLQVMASKQRDMVPADWQMIFADWSNDALLSLNQDTLRPLKVRAWAGWELDFRDAFGIEVPMPKLCWPFSVPAIREERAEYGAAQ